ncbi:MAG TPA: HD domain-containing phosphohydrolase [Solirubrobacterales bacterium]|nr:HD domain-containing phosphohydrolase [Solirubrobacterales bacterium]
MSVAGLIGRRGHIFMLEAHYSPDATQAVGTSPGALRPGPTWDARLRGLVTALEARVPGAAAHARRVAAHSRLVAGRLGFHPREVTRIECAARVHDVGKIIVSPEILEKPGALTPLEFAEVQRHAVFGARLVASVDDPGMTAIVRHHHERIDGSGYPDGLRDAEIPLGAKIVAVADSYDALTSCRPYREANPPDTAIEILQEEAGHTLDAHVVAAFLS